MALNAVTNSLDGMNATLRSHDRMLNRMARRIDANPLNKLNRVAARNEGQNQRNQPANQPTGIATSTAVLSPNVRTIQDLWREWTTGLHGHKAAKDFNAQERGRCKSKFCRRKIVWDLIRQHINAGRLATDVIAAIYAAYPQKSVTQIINTIRRQKSNNELPSSLRF